MKRSWTIAWEAFWRFNNDDGWAIASHIALSGLMSLFPFFLVLTAVAGIVGSTDLANEAARLVLEAWPEEVSAPIATEIQHVLDGAQQQVLTVGALLALFFASSGVESLRIGLNRAYAVVDTRSMWLLRLESIGYVMLGTVAILALSFLVLLAPLIIRTAVRFIPALRDFDDTITFWRLAIASVLIVVPLIVVHKWLPAGRRSFREIIPGILATLVLWLVAGTLFGRYLADFAFTYSVYYAGLASPMIALAFLYFTASIFIYGGELNATLMQANGASGQASPVSQVTPAGRP
ncbi:MAG: YihY/virulence factor BrkB family protein [Pseudorhodoplanes sp.]|nr:MAG: YihY/virulence factor BrkB family protein [Pseudorhodoplanes sp.]